MALDTEKLRELRQKNPETKKFDLSILTEEQVRLLLDSKINDSHPSRTIFISVVSLHSESSKKSCSLVEMSDEWRSVNVGYQQTSEEYASERIRVYEDATSVRAKKAEGQTTHYIFQLKDGSRVVVEFYADENN